MSASALYLGTVFHSRTRPKAHRLRYRIFQMLIDLDEVEDLHQRLRFFSVGRKNLLSFYPRDYLDGGPEPLKARVRRLADRAGVDTGGGAIRLLTMPRVLGAAFNPLSLFFCHRPDGGLAAILYEVNNTFGERHVYVLPVADEEAQTPVVAQTCEKRFFVSPFMPMELGYRFDVRPPGEDVAVRIDVRDAEGSVLIAGLRAERRALTDAALLRAWLSAPLLSLKVVGAIHWEALKLWLKGVKLESRNPAPAMGVTVAEPAT
ncbi:MAG TPA: DUF1365 domain-containing protein [Caulobacteraceae bacterium]